MSNELQELKNVLKYEPLLVELLQPKINYQEARILAIALGADNGRRRSWHRKSGPAARSKGRRACSIARRSASCARPARGTFSIDTTSSCTGRETSISTTGTPAALENRHRNASCREMIWVRLFRSASRSRGPTNRMWQGRL